MHIFSGRSYVAATHIGISLERFPTGLPTGSFDLFGVDSQLIRRSGFSGFIERRLGQQGLAIRLHQKGEGERAAAQIRWPFASRAAGRRPPG